jgi:hypothetical protein
MVALDPTPHFPLRRDQVAVGVVVEAHLDAVGSGDVDQDFPFSKRELRSW